MTGSDELTQAGRHPDRPTVAPHSRRDRASWGLGYALGGWFVALAVPSLLVGVWLAATGAERAGLAALVLGQLGLWAGLLGAPIVASRRKGAGSLERDFGLRILPRDAGGLAVGATCQLVGVPLLYLLLLPLTGELDVSGPARELVDRVDGAGLLALAAAVTVVAPVVEEVFYRGLVLRAAARRWGDRAAILFWSALFGVSHFGVVQFPALFGFGVVLAVLAVRTGRLGTPIAAQVGFNAVTVIVLAGLR